MYIGSFGLGAWLCGLAFIDRHSGQKAAQTINKIMMDLKKKDIKLWVFPEGTRRSTGEIHEFKKGAFHAAIHAQVPIVPVVFSNYQGFLDSNKKIFNDGEVIITALPEISTKGMTTEDVNKLIEKTKSAMIEAFNQSSKEVAVHALKME